MQKKPNVVVCFLGDGATNEGSYHETMNAVGLWKLPVIYVCENNLFSANTSIKLTCCQENVAAGRAEVYGIPSEVVDGNDVMAVNEAATRAIARARAGEGATILELKTYRHGGHSRNDACGYRAKDEEKAWIQDKDPVKMRAPPRRTSCRRWRPTSRPRSTRPWSTRRTRRCPRTSPHCMMYFGRVKEYGYYVDCRCAESSHR